MDQLLVVLIVLSAAWGVISMMVMVSFCSEREIKINWPLLRIFVLRYVSIYREITIRENGKPGFWFYSFILVMNGALVFAILKLLLKS
jgi:hypothetical protein